MSTPLLSIVPDDVVTRVRVLVGEDADAARRGDKKPIALSQCKYYCANEAVAVRCIEVLRDSDERLRARPEELMLWDWQSTFWEPERGNHNGGGTVLLGVAWYDEAFYREAGTHGSAPCTPASTPPSASRSTTSR
ncbi:hypothetical protein [Nocardia terpenica]|uniref:hypothetical protein n=1 Tax=Nocardia terpenica TaxID=455432 RepID=UPI0018E0802E|nr:hypothetical protein [Nocardia terpenica]